MHDTKHTRSADGLGRELGLQAGFLHPIPSHLLPDPDDSFDRLIETEYCDFNSVPEDLREPKCCACATIIYFSLYTSSHIHNGHYHDEDIPWSGIR
jgi:hypothetical protein